MKINIKFLLVIFLFFFYNNYNVLALEVTLTQGTIKPTPIAVTDFFPNENNSKKIGKNVSQLISDNL